jgi:4-amino-4-deoxy-L-arabinose transferase-like glycosyltransferase
MIAHRAGKRTVGWGTAYSCRPMKGRGRRRVQPAARSAFGIGWWGWLSLVTAAGLAIRVGTVIGRPHRVPGGDAYFYHYAANLLVEGKGFINPFIYYSRTPHPIVHTAAFPPGFVFVLAAAALIGFKSFFAQRIWCCIIGAGAVAVCGLAGREIAGKRVGLITAFLVAVYPNIWMNNELGMSETLSPLLVAVVLLLAYRFWKRPGVKPALWLGLAIGVASLARDELSLLGLFIAAPLTLLARSAPWRRRLGYLGASAAAAILVVAPWAGYNTSRFKDPVFISTGLGVTLASANCAATYSGPFEGYWQWDCALRAPINPHADDSVQSTEAGNYAMRFIRAHEGRMVPVELARIGRAFGFYHPMQQIDLDARVETRPYHWALVGLAMFYAMLALATAGAIRLRRSRIPVYPLLATAGVVLVSITLAFGDTRYRSPFEVSLVILSAIELDWLARWITGGRSGRRAAGDRVEAADDRVPAAIGSGGVDG